jgi:5-methylcytosine-specific restriction endonuclease McrA
MIADNHIIQDYLQGCPALSWLSGLGIPASTDWDIIMQNTTLFKSCQLCQESFHPTSVHQKYCDQKCAKESARLRYIKSREGEIGYLKLRFTILSRDNFTCQYCGRMPSDGAKLEIDHIYPRAKGGALLAEDNLIASCSECNLGKSDVLLSKRNQEKLKKR